ncbi:MAG: metalloregulator ArsR/SmtB family transcription factor [Candidatus Woesearchaeota archaeon]|nr:metalloregulator ArsR/SmtB family transcription factor [Candidatus Woesearchaeota archaeon]
MVKQEVVLDSMFHSLSDPIRRDILKRVAAKELSITQIAARYDVSMAAVSKHLNVLEKAKMIKRCKKGRQHLIRLEPQALKNASEYLLDYKEFWKSKLE